MRSVLEMRKIQTVGTVSEFMSGEYKVKDAQKRQKRLDTTLKVVSTIALPIAVGSPLGLVSGVTRAIAQSNGSSTTLLASASDQAIAVPAGAKEWAGDQVLSSLAHVLDPLIDVLVALSFPVASVVIVGACFFFIFGNAEKAWSMIQNAGLGYVLIQVSPLILDVLKKVGDSV